jgi:hypothetical protein
VLHEPRIARKDFLYHTTIKKDKKSVKAVVLALAMMTIHVDVMRSGANPYLLPPLSTLKAR